MSIENHDRVVAKDLITFLKAKGLTDNGICGLLANADTESGLRLNNLQNSLNSKLDMSDDEYVLAVDSGAYTKEQFISDGGGFGLCQWTSSGRKQNLYNWAKGQNVSVASEECQFNLLWDELTHSYKNVLSVLKDSSKTASECARTFMSKFERPKNQSESNINKRETKAEGFYKLYFTKEEGARSTRADIINVALSQVGVKESPKNSNKVKYNVDYYGSNVGEPWCCAFVWDVFRMADASKYFYGGKKTASCTTLLNFYKSFHKGWVHEDLFKAQPGDLVFFQTKKNSNKAQHIGIVTGNYGENKLLTVEGNTSDSNLIGSQDNGGCVAQKTRTKTNKTMWIYKIVSIVYDDDAKGVCPYKEPTTTMYKGVKDAEGVMWVQWYLKTKGYTIDIDGSFGGQTEKVVKQFQKDWGLEIDGRVGKKTREALKH